MSESISVDRSTLLATAPVQNANQQDEINDRDEVPVQARNVSLDDVLERLSGKAGPGSRSEMLQAMGAVVAPQLRKPVTTLSKGNGHAATESAGVAANRTPEGLNGAAALAYWVAKIQKVAADTSDQQLVDSMERFKRINKIQRNSFERQADEAQKKEETAEMVSNVMGWVGKILGGLLVAASVVSAVFTGGTSLVLAGAGLALMAADGIVEATTGESLTGRLISPLIEAVFSPLVEQFAGVISGVLQKFGVKEDIGRMVGAALGAMLAVMAVIVVAVVARSSAASNAVGKITGPLMRSVTKAVPQMLKSMAAKSTALASSMASRVTQSANAASKLTVSGTKKMLSKVGVTNVDPKVISLYAQMTAVGTGTLRGAGAAGTSAWLGVNEERLADIQAEIVRLLTSLPQLDHIIDSAVKEWQNQQSRLINLQKSASDAQEAEQQAGVFALRNVRRVAI